MTLRRNSIPELGRPLSITATHPKHGSFTLFLPSSGTHNRLMLSLSPAAALSLSLSLPGLVKSVAFLLVILNVRSLPLIWHCTWLLFTNVRFPLSPLLMLSLSVKVFWPLTKLWWFSRRARIRSLFSSPMNKNDAQKNYDNLAPIGQNPLDHVSVTKSWAGG